MSKTMTEADSKLLFNTLDRLRETGYTQYLIFSQIEEWRREAETQYTPEFFKGIGVEPPPDAGMPFMGVPIETPQGEVTVV